MGLFDWLGAQISHKAQHLTKVKIPAERDLTGRTGVAAQAQRHYVRLVLKELFLDKDRSWFTERYPLAYSLIGLQYGDQPKAEFANVAGKNKFDMKQVGQGRSILNNFSLTPLLPFRGGEIEVDCGLVSMQAGNVLESFAKTVSDVAGKLNVPQASKMIDIAGAIASGVQALLGAGKAEPVLTVHDTFSAGSLVSGHLLLSSAPDGDIAPGKVWMTEEGCRFGDRSTLGALHARDYLLLSIEVLDSRDDWYALSAIGGPLDKAIEAKQLNKLSDAEAFLLQAKAAASISSDLTRFDMLRVIAGIDRYYQGDFTAGMAAGTEAATGPGASHLARAVMTVTVEETERLSGELAGV
jgi:hypothetical protein